MVDRAFAHKSQRFGPAYEIAEYLRRENPSKRPVYMLTDHIVYWLTDTESPLACHPSNIAEDISSKWLSERMQPRKVTPKHFSKVARICSAAKHVVVYLDDSGKLELTELLMLVTPLQLKSETQSLQNQAEYRHQLD
jgi:hypothetical protein